MIHQLFLRWKKAFEAQHPPVRQKRTYSKNTNETFILKADLDACEDPNFTNITCFQAAPDWTFADHAKVHDAQLWRKVSPDDIDYAQYLLGRRDAFLGRSCLPPRVFEAIKDDNASAMQSFLCGYQDGVQDLLFGTHRVPPHILRAFPDYQDPVLSSHDRLELLKTALFARS